MKTFNVLSLAIVMAASTMSGYSKPKEQMKNNPLIGEWNTPYQTPPFSKIKPEHYMPAIKLQAEQAKQNIDAIVNARSMATFENTIEALEFASMDLERTLSLFGNMNGSETSEELQAIALEMSPVITEFANDVALNERLFDRVKFVYEKRDALDLTTEQKALLEKKYLDFTRNGANLNEEGKAKYRAISGELAELGLKFDQNLLAATNGFKLYLTDEAQLSGLPESVRSMAALEAKNEGKDKGWMFTLQQPSFVPFVTYSDMRELREKMWRESNTKCMMGDSLDNQAIVKRIVELRLQQANLLGYKTFADYVLEDRMAQTTDKVYGLMNELLEKSLPKAKKEKEDIQTYAQSLGFKGELQSWDWAYYTNKYKTEKYNLSDEMTRPYFRVENVEKALFILAGKLYGLTFTENKDIPVYHKDVKAYEVKDENGKFISVLYLDYFPRATKRGGAWMSTFRETHLKDGKEIRPIVTIVCNFTKPTADAPSLLSFNEVTTSLHEFGHALHGMLGKGSYPSITGPAVYRDFVELPSQIMENWAGEKEFLDLWAEHYQTGAKMPADLIKKINDSRQFLGAYNNVRQLTFALNDMAWHSVTKPVEMRVEDFEKQATAKTQILPYTPGTGMSTGFSHVFSGGYAAGYYGYKWAEVLEADAFSQFKEKGVFNKEVADSFRRNILEKGGSEHPMTLYIRFAGGEPTAEALLEKLGIN